MHDVAGEIACAEGCAETISANVLKSFETYQDEFHLCLLFFKCYGPEIRNIFSTLIRMCMGT